MLLVMAELLWWYLLCSMQLIPNAWRVIIGCFSLMVRRGMEPGAWVFHAFFQVKAHHKSQRWWHVSPCGIQFFARPGKYLELEIMVLLRSFPNGMVIPMEMGRG